MLLRCGIFSFLSKKDTFLDDCFFPRLNEIGVTLAGVGTSRLEPETVVAELVSELTGDRPFKCYANVERPLYEKVVCQIPVLVLDKDLRPVSDQDLAQVRLVLVSGHAEGSVERIKRQAYVTEYNFFFQRTFEMREGFLKSFRFRDW